MSNSSLFRVLFLCSALLSLTFCSKSSDSGPRSRIVVLGDPRKVVEGATMNSEIDMSFFKNVKTVELMSIVQFVEKMSYTPQQKSMSQIEKDHAPTAEGEKEEALSYEVKTEVEENNEIVVHLIGSDDEAQFSNEIFSDKRRIGFRNKGKSKFTTEEVLHSSVSKDGRFLSLLVESQEPGSGLTLTAYYFRKGDVVTENRETRDKKYLYLTGPGAITVWPKEKPITLGICGAGMEDLTEQTVEAVHVWNKALEPYRTFTSTVRKTHFFPFSDLNQQCIYHIDSLWYDAEPEVSTEGVTLPIIMGQSTFVDSDIMIFKSEMNKVGTITKERLDTTLLHEIGHFLGLDHQFDPKVPSIMGYNPAVMSLTDYDKAAIQTLYK